MAAPTTILTVVKRFTYRGNASEEYSNTYAFSGTTPASSTAWRSLFDLLVAQEKTLYKSAVSVVGGYGYDHYITDSHGNIRTDTAVWSVDMTVAPNSPVPGTFAGASGTGQGDSACWIRWGLNRLNSKGKRVYLRKYFHPAYPDTASTPDVTASSWITAAVAFAALLDGGTFDTSRKITDHLGTDTVGHAVGPYTTTRTLKRRGKRPPS